MIIKQKIKKDLKKAAGKTLVNFQTSDVRMLKKMIKILHIKILDNE